MGPRSTYRQKLLDPRWQKRRLDILSRDGWKCQGCGAADKTLHVHHRRYAESGDPWDVGDDALVSLCEACHEIESRERAAAEAGLLAAIRRSPLLTKDVRFLTDAFARAQWHQKYPLAPLVVIEDLLTIPTFRQALVGLDVELWRTCGEDASSPEASA